MMATAPSHIRAHRQQRLLELQWPDDPAYQLPFYWVREQCPCAGCIDEFTGEKILDPATIPKEITPTGLQAVGNYALKINWSDNHTTGLYTWDYLYEIARYYRAEVIAQTSATPETPAPKPHSPSGAEDPTPT